MIKSKFFLIIIFLAFSHTSFSMKTSAKRNIIACLYCRTHKVKCDLTFGMDECSNCQHYCLECVKLTPKKRGRKRTKPEHENIQKNIGNPNFMHNFVEEHPDRHFKPPKEKFIDEYQQFAKPKTITIDCVSKNRDEESPKTEEPKNCSKHCCDPVSYSEQEINSTVAFNNSISFFPIEENRAPENENFNFRYNGFWLPPSSEIAFFRRGTWCSIFGEPPDVCDFPHLTQVLDGFFKK